MGILKDVFAPIYENHFFGIYDTAYKPIFSKLYENGGYEKMGYIFILIPLILLGLFYFVWRYPYGKIWHWAVWMGIISVFVFISTIGYANKFLADFLLNEESRDFTSHIISQYGFINLFLAFITGFLISILFKPFSKIQMHLPY